MKHTVAVGAVVLSGALGCPPASGPDLALSGSGGGSDGSGATADDDPGSDPGSDPEAGTGATHGADADEGVATGWTSGADTATGTASDGPGSEDSAAGTTGSTQGTTESSGGSTGEAFDGVVDIGIVAHNDCTFTVTPDAIAVPQGTEFTVNWISSGSSEVEFDVAKIDPFNQVPIILGMEPGTSYHDEVRVWCGDLFTGTFEFRLGSCFDFHYIPVDCGG